MTLRRYSEMKPSRGTTWPLAVSRAIAERDGHRCVGPRIGMPGDCFGSLQKDHVAASHAMGMKSPSTADNGVLLCSQHHREKTESGRIWRPRLVEYIRSKR